MLNETPENNYDRKTLFYDIFLDDSKNYVYIYAPKLFNFESILKKWEPYLDGIHHPNWAIRKYKRFDTIKIKTEIPAKKLRFELAGRNFEVEISIANQDKFKNLNVLCTLSKNNKLEWIYDWMVHHHQEQGATGLIIFDNGSTIYSIHELRQFLSSVPGYEAIEVISAPQPFGPATATARAKFLQPALLNLARARFLNNAAAVLCIDIDELVISKSNENIFEYTKKSLLGFVAFEGEWRYAKLENSFARHADHVWKNHRDEKCASKYCYSPDGVFGKLTLDVHGLAMFGRKLFPITKNFQFIHCRSINTGWKNSRANPKDLRKH